MKKTIEERADVLVCSIPWACTIRQIKIVKESIKQALLEVRNEALEEINEILNEAVEDEKSIGEGAKGHLASQHYGAMMVLEALRERIKDERCLKMHKNP